MCTVYTVYTQYTLYVLPYIYLPICYTDKIISIKYAVTIINPISYGISVPAVLWGGVESTPPAENTLRGAKFQFFSYKHLNLYPTSQNPKKNWIFFQNWPKMKF